MAEVPRMERRGAPRSPYRLPAEIVRDGERHRGFLVDVSASGAFVQTTRTLPVGSEIALWFADDQLAPQVARARVVRRRAVPGSAAGRGGIGVAWVDAPTFATEAASGGWIEVVIDDAACSQPGADGSEVAPGAEPQESAPAPGGTGDASVVQAAPTGVADPSTDAGAQSEAVPSVSECGEIAAHAAPPLVERTLDLAPVSVAAEVVLIDEGELSGIEDLVRSAGARTLRMRWGAQADPVVWESPPKLVIVTARIALAVPLGEAALGAGAVGVAVCDSEASTLRARLRRQGYELAVQRSAHPETLRLLFASLLSRGRERRRQRRRPYGAAATFWRGFRRTRGTLLELSPTGASLLLAEGLARGTRLTVRVAAKLAGARALALPCEVVRSARAPHGAQVGLRFEALGARARAHVAMLLRRLESRGPLASAPSAGVAPPPPAAASGERRRGARARVVHQALALDPGSHVARDVLFGTDLSLGGMRVEPHPRLARGAALEIALQPPGGAAPVRIRAQVARDEGARGLVLRFVALSGDARRALERMLEAASEVERTHCARDAQDQRIVLGTLVGAEGAH